jgi:hypothetical protein
MSLDMFPITLYTLLMSFFTSFRAQQNVANQWFATFEQIATVHSAA